MKVLGVNIIIVTWIFITQVEKIIFNRYIAVFQPCYYWHFGPGSSLLGDSCSYIYRIFSGILGLCLLDAAQVGQPKMYPDIANDEGGKTDSVENHWVL